MTTPKISDHARERCAEMGISTKVAKQIVKNPSLTRPGHTVETRRFVTSTLHPDYAVIYDEATNEVVTVLFYCTERYIRRGESFEIKGR